MLSSFRILCKSALRYRSFVPYSLGITLGHGFRASSQTMKRNIFSYNGFNPNFGSSMNGPVDTEFYDTLEVSPTASQDEIKKAFRKLAMKHHPDKGGDPETFKKIKEAYDILGNPEKRAMYDRVGKSVTEQPDNGPHMSDIDLESILSQLFGIDENMGGGGFNSVRETEDIVQTIPLSLDELYTGCTKSFRMRREKICKECNGTGSKSGKTSQCNVCQGKGYVSRVMNMGGFITRSQSMCPQCHGTGEFISMKDLCPNCRGQKVKKEAEEIEVVIDPGRKQGDKIILPHKSNEYPGAITGDLIFVVQEIPDPVYKRSGMDLLMKQKISLLDSLCGCSIPIKHVNGESFTIKSSKNDIIQPFGVRYVDQLGMPVYNQKNKFGKLFVQFEIEMPKQLTDYQKEILKLVFTGKENQILLKSESKPSSSEDLPHTETNKQETKSSKGDKTMNKDSGSSCDGMSFKESLKEKLFKKKGTKSSLGEKIMKDIESKVHSKEENKDESGKVEDTKTELSKEDKKTEDTKTEPSKEDKKAEDTKSEPPKEDKKTEDTKSESSKEETTNQESNTITEFYLQNCDQKIYANRALWDNIWSPNRRY